jgi:hypothetical protein
VASSFIVARKTSRGAPLRRPLPPRRSCLARPARRLVLDVEGSPRRDLIAGELAGGRNRPTLSTARRWVTQLAAQLGDSKKRLTFDVHSHVLIDER